MTTMLVTGASSGIGRELALRAARAGYAVYAVGRRADALAALAARVADEGGTLAVDAVDLATPGCAAPLVVRALARFGSLDVLVNNAGFVSAGPIAAQSDAELTRQFAVHVVTPLALVREALPSLRAVAGQVFMVGSGVARIPLGGIGAYAPAKAALRSATTILRRELRSSGVGVTYVDPGAVATPFMTRAGMAGAPPAILVPPEFVARKILLAVAARPRELNAAGWQTTLVALAERFPRITEALLARAPGLIGSDPPGDARPDAVAVDAAPAPQAPASPAPAGDALDAALEPQLRRMEKMKLRPGFVRELLVPGTELDTADVAMRWAGMPNKHERALTADVLDALAEAGLIQRTGEHTYRVVRAN